MTTLIDTDDVRIWAAEFCRIFDVSAHSAGSADVMTTNDQEGLMISWFANAMETSKRMYRDRLSVTAHLNDDGAIVIDGDLPQDVLVSSELLRTMVDAHNANIKPIRPEGKLTPERAVRLLRAKVGELETFAKRRLTDVDDDDHRQSSVQTEVGYMAADIALVADLLADHMEQSSHAMSYDPHAPQIIHDPWGHDINPERVAREEKREARSVDGLRDPEMER